VSTLGGTSRTTYKFWKNVLDGINKNAFSHVKSTPDSITYT